MPLERTTHVAEGRDARRIADRTISQAEKFRAAAREIDCDHDKVRFEVNLEKFVKEKGHPVNTKVKMKPKRCKKPKAC